MKLSTLFANRWVLGARPRTLPAAVVPVVMGTAVGCHEGDFSLWRASAALVVALALQVATNYANDYSDGIRGTDQARVGPLRLVGSGLATPRSVKTAAFGAFLVASIVGTVLSLVVQPWLIVIIGIPAVLAGWFYTGGSRPYGYSGLGEVFVFVFFGLAATLGAQFVQNEEVTTLGWVAAVCAGLLAVALLVVNNLRDITGDAEAGKRTLAVRIGNSATRALYAFCVLSPIVFACLYASVVPWLILTAATVVLVFVPLRNVIRGDTGRNLIVVLGATARVQLAFAALFSVGVIL